MNFYAYLRKCFFFVSYTIREQSLAEGMVSELGIERSIRQDTGIFICSALNAYGSDEMSIQLIVQECPEPPRNVRVMDQLSRSIGISWTQPYAGNSPIINYIVQYKPGAGTRIYRLKILKLIVPYKYANRKNFRGVAQSATESYSARLSDDYNFTKSPSCTSLSFKNTSREPFRDK